MDNLNTAIILAGGKSSRMGFDKQFLVINEKRLILDIAKKLKKHFKEIIIVTNKKEYYKDLGYKVVEDEIKGMGPLAGISVGLKNSSSLYAYIIACDMPVLDDNYIKYIKAMVNKDIKYKKESHIYISILNDKIQLFHGAYKKKLGYEMKDYILNSNRKSIISFFERNNKNVYYVKEDEFKNNKFNENMFTNLNTREELDSYKKEIYSYGCG
ncbi:molybdenum cofactor guanylyltransferase [Romboutsia hominis]|uniref:molybdenum cofactor guanylyltransferase n=1 Tax=Romboutsia hominis TaxID=1507512 RepID=UPI001F06B7F3|nr:molybdenum cofactor guanylyltransferase [Romboutsia hominis]MCH1960528.1 molybdenum cofactor guanylyltransferase [Romboutsia hominis]MCH1969040.1 molybdenum cofactor guanylyltransferase [Romboutsia hominis]